MAINLAQAFGGKNFRTYTTTRAHVEPVEGCVCVNREAKRLVAITDQSQGEEKEGRGD
jgi:hypothetical protein